MQLRGKVERITGKLTLPPASNKNALGAEDNCSDVSVQPTAQNVAHVSEVVFCLMNAMRANAGLPALKLQDQLASASVEHSQDMVTNKYFAHDSLDGRDVVARLKNITYIPKSGEWVVGENLAWGAGTLATPKALVNAWMNSPPHRENLLSGDFQEVGMGVVFGTPSKDATDGVTVTTDFGTRAATVADTSSATDEAAATSTNSGAVAGVSASAKRKKKALRRCSRRHGKAKTRCVRAARKVR
jgi:uncharacterized protein YkwD